jgi:hypothetical protein
MRTSREKPPRIHKDRTRCGDQEDEDFLDELEDLEAELDDEDFDFDDDDLDDE